MLIYQLQVGIGPDVHEMYVLCEKCMPHERITDLVLAKLADYSPQILGIKTLSPLMYCMGGYCDGGCSDHGVCPFHVQAGRSDYREQPKGSLGGKCSDCSEHSGCRAKILNMFANVTPSNGASA